MWKVLIVEDSVSDRDILKSFLMGMGDCDCGENGREGYKLYRRSCINEEPYDIILLDIAMPYMGGYTLASLIREHESKFGEKKIPIIAITAHEGSVSKAIEAGCDDCLLKPVDKGTVIASMKMLIEKYCSGVDVDPF